MKQNHKLESEITKGLAKLEVKGSQTKNWLTKLISLAFKRERASPSFTNYASLRQPQRVTDLPNSKQRNREISELKTR